MKILIASENADFWAVGLGKTFAMKLHGLAIYNR